MKKRFGIIGVGGYIAPRHLQAIKDIGGELVCAMDRNDSVGVLDKYSKDVDFFTEFERFDRYCEVLKQKQQWLDYVSICTPNYLHSYQSIFAMRVGANAICEKPLVTTHHILDQLKEAETEYGKKVYAIMQLRYHPEILKLKDRIDRDKAYNINIEYFTPRGRWYQRSWKGDFSKSGGLTMNIGLHFVDMLAWVFGSLKPIYTQYNNDTDYCGKFMAGNAEVQCHLSISPSNQPRRVLTINGENIDFTTGFDTLHTKCYQEIIAGRGWRIEDTREAIEFINLLD